MGVLKASALLFISSVLCGVAGSAGFAGSTTLISGITGLTTGVAWGVSGAPQRMHTLFDAGTIIPHLGQTTTAIVKYHVKLLGISLYKDTKILATSLHNILKNLFGYKNTISYLCVIANSEFYKLTK